MLSKLQCFCHKPILLPATICFTHAINNNVFATTINLTFSVNNFHPCPVYIPSPMVNIFNLVPLNISLILQAAFFNPHVRNITLLHSSHDSFLCRKHKQHFAVAIYSISDVNMVTLFGVTILTNIADPFVS
jgi:hypothetical protein